MELVGLTQDGDGVTLTFRDEHGSVRGVTADYVIACDGAFSPVRQILAEGGGQPRTMTRQEIVPPPRCGLMVEGPGAGTLFPQPMLRSGRLLDTECGTVWRLMLDGRVAEGPAERLRMRAQVLGLRLICIVSVGPVGEGCVMETEGVVAAWFDRHGCSVALVRPDHYVFATGACLAELPHLLDTLASYPY